jgi:heme exporter protein A
LTQPPAAPSPAGQPIALVAESISLVRGHRTILRDLSFRLDAGQALVLTGANGSGKSTLLRALAGYLPTAAGRIVLEGTDGDTPRAQSCHVCGHLDGIKPQLTVAENLGFWAAFLRSDDDRTPAPAALARALSQFQLDAIADSPAAYLSAGQKRRLGLARLLVVERPIWLLDEPTVSLDAASIALLLSAMSRHLSGGGLIVAATHVALPLTGARELRLGATTSEEAAPGSYAP